MSEQIACTCTCCDHSEGTDCACDCHRSPLDGLTYREQVIDLNRALAQMTAENHRLKAEAASSTAPSTSPDAVSNRVAPSGSDSEQLEAHVVRELSPHLTMQALAQQLAQMTVNRDREQAELVDYRIIARAHYDALKQQLEAAEAHVVRL